MCPTTSSDDVFVQRRFALSGDVACIPGDHRVWIEHRPDRRECLRNRQTIANILIVDDEEMDRFLESRMVEGAGHTPIFAGDGEMALKMYKENDIALVITDLQMPKVDGLRLIRDLRAYNPDAIIIAVSGLPQHLERAREFGAVAGLVKPVEPQQLIEAVIRALDNQPEESGDDPWGSGM